jgi:hypothetical protein
VDEVTEIRKMSRSESCWGETGVAKERRKYMRVDEDEVGEDCHYPYNSVM